MTSSSGGTPSSETAASSRNASWYGATVSTKAVRCVQSTHAILSKVASPVTQTTRAAAPGRASRSAVVSAPVRELVKRVAHWEQAVTNTLWSSTASQKSRHERRCWEGRPFGHARPLASVLARRASVAPRYGASSGITHSQNCWFPLSSWIKRIAGGSAP